MATIMGSKKIKRTKKVYGNVTLAEVKAGVCVVPGQTGRQMVVLGGWLRSAGGSAATSTSVDVTDTNGTPVVAAAVAVAALVQDRVVDIASYSASITTTAMGQPLTVGKGIQIKDTAANSLTGSTDGIDYCIEYSVV